MEDTRKIYNFSEREAIIRVTEVYPGRVQIYFRPEYYSPHSSDIQRSLKKALSRNGMKAILDMDNLCLGILGLNYNPLVETETRIESATSAITKAITSATNEWLMEDFEEEGKCPL